MRASFVANKGEKRVQRGAETKKTRRRTTSDPAGRGTKRKVDLHTKATPLEGGAGTKVLAEKLEESASGYDKFQEFVKPGIASDAHTDKYTLPLPALDTGDGRLVPAVILAGILLVCWLAANFWVPSLFLGDRNEDKDTWDETK